MFHQVNASLALPRSGEPVTRGPGPFYLRDCRLSSHLSAAQTEIAEYGVEGSTWAIRSGHVMFQDSGDCCYDILSKG